LNFFNKKKEGFVTDASEDLDSTLSQFESSVNVRQRLEKFRADLQTMAKGLQQGLVTDQEKCKVTIPS